MQVLQHVACMQTLGIKLKTVTSSLKIKPSPPEPSPHNDLWVWDNIQGNAQWYKIILLYSTSHWRGKESKGWHDEPWEWVRLQERLSVWAPRSTWYHWPYGTCLGNSEHTVPVCEWVTNRETVRLSYQREGVLGGERAQYFIKYLVGVILEADK